MPVKWSERIRAIAEAAYVQPSIRAGKGAFAISVREMMDRLKPEGFPARNWPQICTALQTGKFLREKGLEIDRIEGPPSGQSTTVVIHYRLKGRSSGGTAVHPADSGGQPGIGKPESVEERAARLTSRLFGVLKEEIGKLGGTEAYMAWVRSEGGPSGKEEAA